MNIELAQLDNLSDIVALLNSATKKLLSLNIKQWEYPWDSKVIEEDIVNNFQYIVKNDNKIMAVFSLKDMSNNQWTNDTSNNQMYLYRIAVDPIYQGNNVGHFICDWVQNYSKQNKRNIYLDCWAGNEKLRSFYKDAGFLFVGDYPEDDYFISVFRYDFI
jgi:ribosomal protein S18 acetylase RimI-like enzyme